MSKMYKLMSLKGYNGPEDVIKLQEWLAIEKQIFIETRVCWNKEGTFPIGYSARAWMPPYTLYKFYFSVVLQTSVISYTEFLVLKQFLLTISTTGDVENPSPRYTLCPFVIGSISLPIFSYPVLIPLG